MDKVETSVIAKNRQPNIFKCCKLLWTEHRGRTPRGHIVVYVGEKMRRFVVPISCLRNAQLQELFEESAEVYGYYSNCGKIVLPCSESAFFGVLNCSEEGYECHS
ncbi:SAUR-like auxin-responsive protein family [Striga hermonthica]|uniref:SAUR-like auxin-responsive protein family n=1 Tax=Striga hermonthica TaxID=68872 RepID=A0A9N7MQ93_STRHE|nr:SAUR-like auxin-responsive protein family [Striga hermonthica]